MSTTISELKYREILKLTRNFADDVPLVEVLAMIHDGRASGRLIVDFGSGGVSHLTWEEYWRGGSLDDFS